MVLEMFQKSLSLAWRQAGQSPCGIRLSIYAVAVGALTVCAGTATAGGSLREPLEARNRIAMLHSADETEIKLFQVVNKTGARIKVRVSVDGKALFARRMEAPAADPSGVVHPDGGSSATLTLKVPIKKAARRLTVRESLLLKKAKTISIAGGPTKGGAGFQIVITKDGIAVTQDYYPSY